MHECSMIIQYENDNKAKAFSRDNLPNGLFWVKISLSIDLRKQTIVSFFVDWLKLHKLYAEFIFR